MANGDASPDPGSPDSATPSASQSRNLVVRERNGARNVSGSKRKRAGTASEATSNYRRRTAEPESAQESEGEDDGASTVRSRRQAQQTSDDESGDDNDVYDPDQPVAERRRVQQGLRNLLQDLTENSEEYLQGDSRGILTTIEKADEYLKDVKRPGEATSDSRLLVGTTDLSYRKALRLHQGGLSQGVDVDEFVSKCITYMRQGRGIQDDNAPELSSTQRQRRRRTTRVHDGADDEIGDEGDMMNWAHLGQFAVLPFLRRPALPGLLLGPLSVEKKTRKITKRAARFRPEDLTETRPEVLNIQDLAAKENDLTAICGHILQQLQATQTQAQQEVADLVENGADNDEVNQLMEEHGLHTTGGIDMMKFVVNPKSFGQTIENMFYVSFLIRDGRVQVEFDDNDLPSVCKY
jgi:hypothetical protein